MINKIKKLISPSHSSYENKQRSIVIGLIFGVFGLIPAIVIVVMANSLTVLSDLLRNVGMVFAVFFSWMTVQRVAQGKNPIYNYGYGKMENLSSLVTAGVMLVSITIVVLQTVQRFQNPVSMGQTGMGVGVILSGLAAMFNAWLCIQSYRTAKKEQSAVMESLYRLYQVKTMSTICVMSSLGLSLLFKDHSWAVYIDPIGSVVLLGFMIFSTWGVISSSVFDLLDRTLSDSLQLIVLKSLASHFDSYEAIHGVRSRRSGNIVYVELFLEFDPDQRIADVQKNIDVMITELQDRIPGSQVVIIPSTNPP
jgi:ferrous-iron efflux pump FieF